MAKEVGLAAIVEQIGQSVAEENIRLTDTLLWPALDQYPDIPQLWYHAGNHLFSLDKISLAAMCYERSIELEPNATSLANLGAAFRRLNQAPKALNVLHQSVALDPNSKSAWTNLAACYINEGNPQEGLEFINRALEIDPNFDRARWNAALINLELGNFRKGFELYEAGLGADRLLHTYGEAKYLTDARHELHRGRNEALIVYGEQGIGDELMFGSILYDLKKDYNVTFDCHPRLSWFFEQAHPDITVRPTRKENDQAPAWIGEQRAQLYVALADTAKFYRPSRSAFTKAWKANAPFYEAPADETQEYRAGLEALANGRKIIGLATRGGVIKTNRHYRTIRPPHLAPILGDDRYFFVSLDYEAVDPMVEEINKEFGPNKIVHWRAVNHHFDYQHTAALVKATDCLITVCQSVFHLAGCLDHPTCCLAPAAPAWRYGLTGKRAYWYPGNNIRLFRAKHGQDWQEPMDNLKDHLEVVLGGKQ